MASTQPPAMSLCKTGCEAYKGTWAGQGADRALTTHVPRQLTEEGAQGFRIIGDTGPRPNLGPFRDRASLSC